MSNKMQFVGRKGMDDYAIREADVSAGGGQSRRTSRKVVPKGDESKKITGTIRKKTRKHIDSSESDVSASTNLIEPPVTSEAATSSKRKLPGEKKEKPSKKRKTAVERDSSVEFVGSSKAPVQPQVQKSSKPSYLPEVSLGDVDVSQTGRKKKMVSSKKREREGKSDERARKKVQQTLNFSEVVTAETEKGNRVSYFKIRRYFMFI